MIIWHKLHWQIIWWHKSITFYQDTIGSYITVIKLEWGTPCSVWQNSILLTFFSTWRSSLPSNHVSMSRLSSFFHFCAGGDAAILRRTPTDQQKYASIGATVFFTGVFAAIAGGFALHTVFKSMWVAIPFGLLWGMMIFNLDRYIVMSIKKKGSRWQELGMALPRVMLAVLIAFVIAKPLELKLFASEIGAELVLMEQEVYTEQESALKGRFVTDIQTIDAEVAAIEAQISQQQAVRDELHTAAIQEADGTGGSGLRNLGPIYKAKKADADRAQSELDALLAEKAPLLAQLQVDKDAVQSKINTELTALDQGKLDGFAAQLDALGRLARKSTTIFWASLFITLLFIAIETAPLFVKLISQRSPYDYRLNQHEVLAATSHDAYVGKLQVLTDAELRYQKEVSRHEVLQSIGAEKEVINEVVKEELGRLREQAMGWQDYKSAGRRFS